jgi:hypothetical protein
MFDLMRGRPEVDFHMMFELHQVDVQLSFGLHEVEIQLMFELTFELIFDCRLNVIELPGLMFG